MNTFSMSLRNILVPLLLVMTFMSLPVVANAQKKKPQILEIGGKVRFDEGRFDGATIEVHNTDNNKIEQRIDVAVSGKFDFQLPYQHNYQLIFKKNGFYPKMLILTTVIPDNVLARDPYFPPVQFVVTLFKVIPEVDPSFSKKPVGKIFYSAKVDNFDSESYFNDMQIRQKLDEEVAKIADASYQKKLDEAKTLEEAGKLAEAIAVYQQAADLKPKDDFVKDKIKLLGEQIRLKEEQSKQNDEFKRLIADADGQVTNKAYKNAIDTYNRALKIKPDDPGVKAKIDKVNGLIAAQEEAAKQKALADARQKQFDDAVAKGDQLFGQQSYADATAAFNQALQLQPGAQHPTEMLDKIQEALAAQKKAADEAAQQKALAGARQKQFDDAVAKGDQLFGQQSYADATAAFNQALQLQPGAQHPTEMLDKIQEALAAQKKAADEAAQQKALAEARQKQFDDAVDKGAQLFAQQSYSDATAAFNQALQLQPDAQHPKEMLDKIDAALAAKEKAQEDAERQKALADALQRQFNAAVSKGDSLFALQSYTDATAVFNHALQLQPDAQHPQEMLSKIQAAMSAEKRAAEVTAQQKASAAAKQQQYNLVVARGDSLFTIKSYQESILAFQQALQIQSDAQYPKEQIVKIQAVIAEQDKQRKQALAEAAKKQTEAEAEQRRFSAAIAKGDSLFRLKIYDGSISAFNEALQLQPDAVYPSTMLDKIKKAIAEQKQLQQQREQVAKEQAEKDKQYADLIAKADQEAKANQLMAARQSFNDARKIKPEETYPIRRVNEINALLAEQAQKTKEDQEKEMADQARKRTAIKEKADTLNFHYTGVVEDLYLKNIKNADAAFASSKWTVARFFYYEAEKYKPSEKYPQKQVDACDKAIEANLTAEREKEYQGFISKADASMKSGEFTLAKFYYLEALKIKDWEDYPKHQLIEVENAVSQKHAAEQESQFRSFVKKADEAFDQKDISVARFYYRKALALKPDESYPKTQLDKLSSM